MTADSISWGSPTWWAPALGLLAIAVLVLLVAYRRAPWSSALRIAGGTLKAIAFVLLGLCLVEPLLHGQRVRPGANSFVILVDTSESLSVRDPEEKVSRGEALRELLRTDATWQSRLSEDFDVRRYAFDSRLSPVESFADLAFDGEASALRASLEAIAMRYRERPIAGVLVFTDGIATDGEPAEIDGAKLPPIYAVPVGADGPIRDLAIARVTVNQTPFETAPITVQVEVFHEGYEGEKIVTRILDESGNEVERTLATADKSGHLVARFQLNPEESGVHFYRVEVAALLAGEAGDRSEWTLANNARLVTASRTQGPYRVLYVCGRPNWEFKFLSRALEDDEEVELVGLIRIAKREPKFEYRSRLGESTNPLFRGFGKEDDEDAERYDQPVLLRIGTTDENELREGFPKAEEQLFQYDAVILDDVEAEYFTRDQMNLLRSFVSRRGGGFLMMGGQESFAQGDYRRTPVEEILPVYLDSLPPPLPFAEYRVELTREGWIQPWVRLRDTEEAERARRAASPAFRTLNRTQGIKPGAMVLARAEDGAGNSYPALVTQPFGRGRTGALLVGDLWRWSLRRATEEDDDAARALRQTVRWLVADVPRRVEAEIRGRSPTTIAVKVRDESYEALDNASVAVEVTGPDGVPLELVGESSSDEPGLYEAIYNARRAGGYRALASVRGPDGAELGTAEVGWTANPAAEEFRSLRPDRRLLERLARSSGGELVEPQALVSFVESLPERAAPITEPWVTPLWDRWWVFLLVIICLCGEWALRRWGGLP